MEKLKEDLTKIFESKFDRIYVIHLLDYKNRWQPFLNELNRIGLLNCNNLEFFYDVISPLDTDMLNCFRMMEWYKNRNGVKKLTLNHYKIMKEAISLNYERILIIEDDLRFLKNLDNIYSIISGLPKKSDISMLEKGIVNEKTLNEIIYPMLKKYKEKYNAYFVSKNITNIISTGCYALTLKGCEYITKNIELTYEKLKNYNVNFFASDRFTNDYGLQFYDDASLVRSFSLYNIAIQGSVFFNKTTDDKEFDYYNFLNLNEYNFQQEDENILKNERLEKIL